MSELASVSPVSSEAVSNVSYESSEMWNVQK